MKRAEGKVLVGVLSAHEGGAYWIRTLQGINRDEDVSVVAYPSFDDRRYRGARGLFSRMLLRLSIYIVYPLVCVWKLLAGLRDVDVVLVITSPFFLPAICAFFARGKPVISLQNDLYPEALVLGGIVRRGSWLESLLRQICAFGIRKSASVVYLSESHRAYAEKHLSPHGRSWVIPVGALGEPFRGIRLNGPSDTCRILYCGTLGHMHDTQTIIDYLRSERIPHSVMMEFRTSGAAAQQFDQSVGEIIATRSLGERVFLGKPLAEAEWMEKMTCSQVGLVLQRPGGENVIFPSKAYSVLMAGQAILVVAPPSSELAKLVVERDCGWVVRPGDVAGLANAIEELSRPEILQRKRENAYRVGHSQYDVDKLSLLWIRVIKETALRPAPTAIAT